MRNIILIVHTSLDGFVAAPDGSLKGFNVGDDNLEFVCSITAHADAALFGRISYKLLDDYWPEAHGKSGAAKSEIAFSNWYNTAEKIILSKTITASNDTNTTIISNNVYDQISKIKQQQGKDILIFGSPSVFQLLFEYKLIDAYWVFINPVIFGEGIPLFAPGKKDAEQLKLISTHQLVNGELALHYIVDRKNT